MFIIFSLIIIRAMNIFTYETSNEASYTDVFL